MKRIVLISTLFTTFFGMSAYCQQLSFKSYTSAQGLSQNSGYAIAQDGLGYIWMGTQDGLNKFNGRKIVSYYKENVTRGVLCNSFIKSLYYDSIQNWLWIGTGNGICIYNVKSDSFYNATHYFPSVPALNDLMIRSVTGISSYETAIVTFYEGIFICNSKLKTVKQFFKQPETKSVTTAVVKWNNKIIAANDGRLYVINKEPVSILPKNNFGDVRKLIVWQNELWLSSSTKGLFKISGDTSIKAVPFDCGSKEIGPLMVDNDDNLWVGTRNKGVVVITPVNFQTIYSYETANNQDEWPQKFTLSLLKDKQGTIWVGSSGGGFTACNKNTKKFGLIRKREPVAGKAAHNMILCMYHDNKSMVFLGTQLEGIRKYNTQTGQTESYKHSGLPGSNSIYGITATSSSALWLATAGGLHYFDLNLKKIISYTDNDFPASLYGQSLYKLKGADSLLYSSNEGTLFFDLKNKKFKPFTALERYEDLKKLMIYKSIQDDDGVLWMGCLEKGLIKYNPKTNSLKVIDTVRSLSKEIYTIYCNKDLLWLGTSNGLIVYNYKKNKLVKVLTMKNGLPGNVIYSIEKDDAGDIWCSSNVGLIKVNPQTFDILHITVSAGLQSGEFNAACSLKDSLGNLYFGGINGVSFFNPKHFNVSQFSPKPLLESFRVFNKEIPLHDNIAYTKKIALSHNQNFITIEFGVTNYNNNEACIFRYQLTDADEDWVMAGTRTYANYTNLKPGDYTFKLQSANASGIWSKDFTTLSITISPAWWQTWWLRLICFLSVLTFIFVLIKKRISNIRQEANFKNKIAETEIAALKAQMNPHFIFNCINSIDAYIHSNDKYNATLYLNKFARLLRNILDSSKQNTVAFTKDIETLKLYIELEELRHENKFKTSITIDEELLSNDYKVPPLIIQPFVENAILHGLKNKPGNNGLLQIGIEKTADKIKYSIKDNGIGRKASGLITQTKESSYGMQMSYDRIKLFNKEEKPSVEIVDLYIDGIATGTEIKVGLNLI